jgi:hypothetical protein
MLNAAMRDFTAPDDFKRINEFEEEGGGVVEG